MQIGSGVGRGNSMWEESVISDSRVPTRLLGIESS